VGFSRIALGAHFLTDVLAAMFFGILWLMLWTVLGKSILRRPALAAVPVSDRANRAVDPVADALPRKG